MDLGSCLALLSEECSGVSLFSGQGVPPPPMALSSFSAASAAPDQTLIYFSDGRRSTRQVRSIQPNIALGCRWSGHEGVVKILLEPEEVNPDKPDNSYQTPLSNAAQNRHE